LSPVVADIAIANSSTGSPAVLNFSATTGAKTPNFVTPDPIDAKRDEIAQKTQGISKTCKAGFADRPPLNVLGNGHRWPNSTSVGSNTLKAVISTELSSIITSALTADQQQEVARLIESIPVDLSIPPFLRRSSS
jgi:hypothetical protein